MKEDSADYVAQIRAIFDGSLFRELISKRAYR